MSYHIAKNGKPAQCNASERTCPLGGQHFESQRQAMEAVNELDVRPLVIDPHLPTMTPEEFQSYRIARANAEQNAFVQAALSEPEEVHAKDEWLLDWLSSDEAQREVNTPY